MTKESWFEFRYVERDYIFTKVSRLALELNQCVMGDLFLVAQLTIHTPLESRLKMYAAIFPLPHMSVVVRTKIWVCRRCLTVVVGLNPARSMDNCLLCLLCVVR